MVTSLLRCHTDVKEVIKNFNKKSVELELGTTRFAVGASNHCDWS